MAYLIGIDVGTTGAKTILVDETGQLHASALEEYPLHTPQPKWAEQDPADWWQATVKSIQRGARRIAGFTQGNQGVGTFGSDARFGVDGQWTPRPASGDPYGVMCERQNSAITSQRLSVRIC